MDDFVPGSGAWEEDLEEEAKKIAELQQEWEAAMSSSSSPTADSKTVDMRSVYVGNVDYGGSLEELQAHFNSCGTINRVTILCDRYTGKPKGFDHEGIGEEQRAPPGKVGEAFNEFKYGSSKGK